MMSSSNKLCVPQSIPYMIQFDKLPTDSEPDQTETLDVSLPISIPNNGVLISENYQSFNQQLSKSDYDEDKSTGNKS